MANRFENSAKRIIDGNFGSLKKSFDIIKADGYNYDNQQAEPIIVIGTTALKRNLTKIELDASDVQIGDFALIFTSPQQVDVDNHSGIYDGIAVDIISVLSLPADAAQTIIARVK